MQWLECTVPGGDDPEELCSALAELGVGGMSIENERDFHDFLENNRACWDYVDEALEESFSGVSRVKFWLSCDAEGESVLAAVRAAGYSVETRVIADEDWENNWKQYYKPLPVGEKLVVVPAWEEQPADGRVTLRLDPGLIFGTGRPAAARRWLAAAAAAFSPSARLYSAAARPSAVTSTPKRRTWRWTMPRSTASAPTGSVCMPGTSSRTRGCAPRSARGLILCLRTSLQTLYCRSRRSRGSFSRPAARSSLPGSARDGRRCMMMAPKAKRNDGKRMVSRALKGMGDVIDDVSDALCR